MKVGLGFVWVGLLQIPCLQFVWRPAGNLSDFGRAGEGKALRFLKCR